MANVLVKDFTAKTTPVDADVTLIIDSEASNDNKKITFGNIYNYVKGKADLIYQEVLVSGTNIKTVGGVSLLGSGDVSAGTGDVVGPASSTDNAITRFDSTTGKLLQNSTVTLGDDGTVNNVNSVKFDTSYTGTPAEGELYWNSDEKTLNIKTGFDTVVTQIGREHYIMSNNNTGSTIVNGAVVYITGATGSTPTCANAQANDYTKSSKTIGVATMDITNGTDGLVTTYGMVRDLNTSGFTAGDVLYLSSSVSGGLTNTNPTGINYTIRVGYCITSHASTGIILVDPKGLLAIESDEFKVVDSTDKTKQAAFNVASIGAGTKRIFTLPNADTTLVGETTTNTLTNKSISLGTNTVTSTFAQLNTAVTDADLARTDAANTFTGTQTITQIDVGNTDTSITRSAAGIIAVEGIAVPTISSTSTLTNKDISSATNTYRAASTTATGAVELAITSEIDTGTDTTRAMPVDQFVASNRNVRYVLYRILDSATDVTTGTTKGGDFEFPFTGTITAVGGFADTAGTTGTMVVDINKAGSTIMTTNKLSFDSTEKTTRTAATQPTLTTTAITAGDILTFDIDSIQTTPAKGLTVRLEVRLT